MIFYCVVDYQTPEFPQHYFRQKSHALKHAKGLAEDGGTVDVMRCQVDPQIRSSNLLLMALNGEPFFSEEIIVKRFAPPRRLDPGGYSVGIPEVIQAALSSGVTIVGFID